jgi:hypothetical protein
MKKTTNTGKQGKKARSRRVRMAYALNNTQPVRCTIVSDQPLFYMDVESDTDEDLAFDIETAASALSAEIFVAAPGATRVMEEFLSDADFMTVPTGAGGEGHDYEFEIALLTRTLERSRLAGAYIECMQRHGGHFTLNDQVETASYDRATGIIHINPDRSRADQLLLAARELRRLWQHRNGALIDPLTFHPDQAILVNRAQIADLSASMVRIAWELQLAGEKDCWMRLESSALEDLARAFAREAFLDFRTVNNGTANSAVFEAWFLSERCGYEDRKLIQQMLSDYQGYTFEDDGALRGVTAKLLNALGSMPFGKNYLSPYINTVMTDALFTEVRDRSNANFLWFIKFERTFREAEQDLQTVDASDSHSISMDGASLTPNAKRSRDHEKTADIVTLPRRQIDNASMGKTAGARGGDVVQFRGSLGREQR